MEPSTPEPTATPDPVAQPDSAVTPEPVVTPVPAALPNLSLDDAVPAAPPAPDLDAVASAPSDSTNVSDAMNFDLGPGGYAETLAQQSYGQPVTDGQPASEASAPVFQQPTPYPQPAAPSAGQAPYAETPYAQPNQYAQANPYAQQNPYAQANPYAEPNPYPPVPYSPAAPGALTPDEERTWASAAHWSALVTTVVGLGFLGPLLVYLIQGPKSAWVKAQAAESLNFEITYLIAMIASLVAMFVFIGFVTILVFPILWLIFRIIATVATSQGRDYRYPVNIRMVK